MAISKDEQAYYTNTRPMSKIDAGILPAKDAFDMQTPYVNRVGMSNTDKNALMGKRLGSIKQSLHTNVLPVPQYTVHVYNYRVGKDIPIPYMPNNISESIKANYSEQAIVGSSRPFVCYTSTSLRTISFTIQNLSQDYLPVGYNDLATYIHALQSLEFPEYESSGLVRPPDCHLYMGDRSFRCVCNSVNVTWSDMVRESSIMSCNVDLQFTNTRNDNQVPRSNLDLQ